ncbi:MAG: hypothetical protein JO157_03810 [Acetobacteraceae bacterium]|nr:hypothetical protein [Acetobacteraceae bacterium]
MPHAQDHWRPSLGALLAHLHYPRPWHRGSLFGEGPRRALSADQRRAWLARACLERRAGRLTALWVEVGRALLRRLGTDGRCDPAHATLAADASCSERTVRRALAALREVGLLTWEQRLVRRPWPEGGAGATRCEQTSNAYELLPPGVPIAPHEVHQVRPLRLRPDCGGHAGRETLSQMIPREALSSDPAAQKALQEIAAARALQLQREWSTKRAERWSRNSRTGPS